MSDSSDDVYNEETQQELEPKLEPESEPDDSVMDTDESNMLETKSQAGANADKVIVIKPEPRGDEGTKSLCSIVEMVTGPEVDIKVEIDAAEYIDWEKSLPDSVSTAMGSLLKTLEEVSHKLEYRWKYLYENNPDVAAFVNFVNSGKTMLENLLSEFELLSLPRGERNGTDQTSGKLNSSGYIAGHHLDGASGSVTTCNLTSLDVKACNNDEDDFTKYRKAMAGQSEESEKIMNIGSDAHRAGGKVTPVVSIFEGDENSKLEEFTTPCESLNVGVSAAEEGEEQEEEEDKEEEEESICQNEYMKNGGQDRLTLLQVKWPKRNHEADRYLDIKLRCEQCQDTYPDEKTLQIHMQKMHAIKKDDGWECLICGKISPSERRSKQHMKAHVARIRKCPAPGCKKSFTQLSVLKLHIRTHTGERPYTCEICGKAFSHNSNLNAHKGKHMTSQNCECGRSFSSQQNLIVHQANTCAARTKALLKSIESRDSDPNKVFKCWNCDKLFVTELELEHHQKDHEGATKSFPCRDCDHQFKTPYGLTQHAAEHREELYQCHICTEEYHEIELLKKHLVSHSDGKNYHCEECKRSFITEMELNLHRARHKSPSAYLYECEFCLQLFRHSNTFRAHMAKHTGDNSQTHADCPVCGKSFTKGAVKRHMRTHTGEKKYKCGWCGESFASPSPLVTHMVRCNIASQSSSTGMQVQLH